MRDSNASPSFLSAASAAAEDSTSKGDAEPPYIRGSTRPQGAELESGIWESRDYDPTCPGFHTLREEGAELESGIWESWDYYPTSG